MVELLCVLCHQLHAVDDAVIRFRSGRMVCIGCFVRETQTDRKPLPRWMREAVEEAMKGCP